MKVTSVSRSKAWDEEHQDVIVYSGGPLGKTKRTSRDGVTDVVNELTVFVVVRAPSHEAAAKMFEGEFTFDDFLEQMQQLKKMGSLSSLIGMMPGVPKELKSAKVDDEELKRVEAIIHSMTTEERRRPDLINGSRRLRIATGSGTSTGEVNRLVKQFQDVQKMMKKMGGLGTKKGKRRGQGGSSGSGASSRTTSCKPSRCG